MKRLALVIVAVFVALSATQASAEWRTRSVPHSEQVKVQVKVFPPMVVRKCSEGVEHWVQPDPYWEERTETRTYYTTETYWVADQIVWTNPIYVPPVYVYPSYPVYPVYPVYPIRPWRTAQPYIYIAP
jgi:hypothetical protein